MNKYYKCIALILLLLCSQVSTFAAFPIRQAALPYANATHEAGKPFALLANPDARQSSKRQPHHHTNYGFRTYYGLFSFFLALFGLAAVVIFIHCLGLALPIAWVYFGIAQAAGVAAALLGFNAPGSKKYKPYENCAILGCALGVLVALPSWVVYGLFRLIVLVFRGE